ncbi:MAG: hypothetical protein DMG49_07245 [Acidobacteria bacterium]|nr:MAG: hypothetical protein DMG49_07245 [Acidobacteriota bacterium]
MVLVAARFAVCGFLTVRAKTLCGRPGRSKEYPGRFSVNTLPEEISQSPVAGPELKPLYGNPT